MSQPTTKTDASERGRPPARLKTGVVLRPLPVEDLDPLSRELGVTASTLPAWRADSLDGGTAAMRSRPADDEDEDEVIAHLRSEVGQLTMDVEPRSQGCHYPEGGRPFVPRRRADRSPGGGVRHEGMRNARSE